MKKLLAMLLAVVMVLGLMAGCGSDAASSAAAGSSAPEAATSEAASTPAEETVAADFTWNGQKEVWSILPTTSADGLVWINDTMGAIMTAEGFNYVKKDGGQPCQSGQLC